MSSKKYSPCMHELRYFKHVIAMSDDTEVLWLLKCQMIVNNDVRWHEALKIYWHGQDEWLFDYLPTKKQASYAVVNSYLGPFVCAMYGCSCMKRYKDKEKR